MTFKKINVVEPIFYVIHMAGDLTMAKYLIRKFVMRGSCVQLSLCDYIYTGGLEQGFTVRFMHYARFPSEREVLEKQAEELAFILAEELGQISFTIESDIGSAYYQKENFNKS